jgi:putative ABC transport system permease protein
MRFLTFILKNIARRRFRSTFTVVGVAMAVGAVVALVGISSGFQEAFLGLYQQRGIDMVVIRAHVTERLSSALDERIEASLRKLPDVRDVSPVLMDVVSFEDVNLIGVTVYGWRPGSAEFHNLDMISGRPLAAGDKRCVMLGTLLAKNLGKKVGDSINIYEDQPFEVVGIFRSFSMVENASMVVPLTELQRLTDRKGQVTMFDILLKNPADKQATAQLIKDIEGLGKGLAARTTQDYVSSNTQIRAGEAMAWVTSMIALVIGTVGVLNTMFMSVVERTLEIGILRAVGWRPSRVLHMILIESLLLSLAGAIVGTTVAVLLCRFLSGLPEANGLITGQISVSVILEGFMIALAVGFIGGGYPALRGSRLSPTEALRHE